MTIVGSYFRERVPAEVHKLLDPDASEELIKRINGEFFELCIFGRRRLAIVYEARVRKEKTINFVIKFLAERFERSTSTIYRWLAWLKFNGAVERGVESGQKVTRWLWEYLAGSKDADNKPLIPRWFKRKSSAAKVKIAVAKRENGEPSYSEPPATPEQIRSVFKLALQSKESAPLSASEFERRRAQQVAELRRLEAEEKARKESPELPQPTHEPPEICPRE